MEVKDLPVCHVAYACNDAYAIPTGVSIYSLFKNNKELRFCVHLFSEGISENNKNIFMQIAKDAGQSLVIEDMPDLNKVAGAPLYIERLALSTYLRIFLVNLLDSEINKVLWIDGDTLVLGSIAELFFEDIASYAGAAALNVNEYNKRLHGFKRSDMYYNVGIFLFNLQYWREHKVLDAIIKEIQRRHGKAIDHDQDILNCTLKEKIKTLHPKFNFVIQYEQACLYYNSYLRRCGYAVGEAYSQEVIKEAAKDIRIYHIIVASYKKKTVRPWYSNCAHPIIDAWRTYLDGTPWRGTQFPPYKGKTEFTDREMKPFLIIRIKRKINRMLVYHVKPIRLLYIRIKYGFWHL